MPARVGLLVWAAVLAAAAVLLAGASAARALPAGSVTEFPLSSHEESEPRLLAPGSDGNLWFTIYGNKAAYWAIGRVSPDGTFASELTEGLTGIPYDVAPGPDGAMWFTQSAPDGIGRVATGGTIGVFTAGLEAHEPERIALGPDGNLWFSLEESPTFNSIGWVTPAGEITVVPPAQLLPGSRPNGLTAGPDGDVWFADGRSAGAAIGRVTPCGPAHCTPTVEEFTGGLPLVSDPESIVTGPDGNLWFTDVSARAIGRVVPCGAPCTPTIEEFKLGSSAGPYVIATGPDGKLWFTDPGPTRQIGQIVPCSPTPGCTPTIGESAAGLSAGTEPWGIAPGPDGSMWFADKGTPRAIGRIGTGAPAALQSPPAIAGGGLAGSPQTCAAAAWSTWAGVQPSASLFGFDGYRWQLDGAAVASGQTYTPTAAQAGHSLTCSETVTYPLPLLVTAPAATSAAMTVASVPAKAAPPLLALRPRVTGLRQSAPRWRTGRKLARISARRRLPVGTTFSFALSERASLRLAFARRVVGRRVAGRCVARTRKNARRKACRRTLIAAISLTGHAGSNHVHFQGRLSSRKALRPASYTMTLTAVNAAGLRSVPQSLKFTIVR